MRGGDGDVAGEGLSLLLGIRRKRSKGARGRRLGDLREEGTRRRRRPR